MAVTEPADLAYPGGNRNSEDTETTNEMAKRPGFPARKEDGTLVLIVDQMAVGTTKVLIDEHGNQYRDDQVNGVLVPAEAESVEELDESDVAPITAAEAGDQDSIDAAVEDVEGHEVQTEDFETTMDRFGASEPGETFQAPAGTAEEVEAAAQGLDNVEASPEDLSQSA